MKAEAVGITDFHPRDKSAEKVRRRSKILRRSSSSRMYQDSKGLPYMKTTVAVKTLKGILLKSCIRAFTVDFTNLGGGGVEDVLRSALKFHGGRGNQRRVEPRHRSVVSCCTLVALHMYLVILFAACPRLCHAIIFSGLQNHTNKTEARATNIPIDLHIHSNSQSN